MRQTFNTYDSVVELRIGGSCPGTDVAYCQDDPDVDEISVTNTFSEAQLVYYLQVPLPFECVFGGVRFRQAQRLKANTIS